MILRGFLIVFLLLRLATAQTTCAPTGAATVGCIYENSYEAYDCVTSPADCPARPACNASSAYALCVDNVCAAHPQDCLTRLIEGGTICASWQCWDGSCATDIFQCPNIPPCPNIFDVRCSDLSCSQNCSGLPALPSDTLLSEFPSIFNTSIPSYILYNVSGCYIGDVRCPDGSCEPLSQEGNCQTGPSNGAANGQPNWGGCSTGTVRCWGDRFGVCNNSVANCSVPPAYQRVMPFTAPIGPNGVTYSLVSMTDTTQQLGWIYSPPFLTSGTVNLVLQPQQMPGWMLYPFDITKGSITWNANLTGVFEMTTFGAETWRISMAYPPVDSPAESIFSPIIGLSSPQLYDIFWGPNSTDQGETALQLYDQKWNLNITMYAYPPYIGPCGTPPLCLASLTFQPKYSPIYPVWACVDSRPVQLQPNLWSGLVPVWGLANQTYFAFVALYSAADCTYPPPATVGGGFFAAGMIAVVVGGIILLANREKVVGVFVKSAG